MGATSFDGPAYIYGPMAALQAGYGDATPDPNGDAGPSMTYQGDFLPDVRYPFLKDKVQGYTGVVPGMMNEPFLQSVDQVPGAAGVATIAAAANAVNGTAMTLVTVQAAGITPGVPIRPNTSPFALNSGAVTTVLALDFGFAFGNCVAANAQITVADSTQFTPGMPLVIPGAGVGAAALLTLCNSIVDATHITVGPNIPATSNATAPIGTGNLWGPSPVGFPVPDAHLPGVAAGPGLLFDPRQTICRNVSITGSTSATGGHFIVTGYDDYFQLQTENINAGAGAVTTFGKKTWKAILSVVPQFSDAHNYSVGTGDVFGFAYRTMAAEYLAMFYNGTFNAIGAQTANGWLAADTTNPATSTTGDVRGTWQVSANGGGTAWNAANAGVSNGSISGLVMTGKRLAMWQTLRIYDQLTATPANPVPLFGVTPA